jgi:DNA-binding response OmpR family regulator
MERILVVEADERLGTARCDELAADGFDPTLATSEPIARRALASADALVVGELATRAQAARLVRDLRAGEINTAHPAMLVITFAAHEHEHIRAYQAGANVVLSSDCSPLLLAAALRAAERSAALGRDGRNEHITAGGLHIDVGARAARVNGRELKLTRRQFQVLTILARDAKTVVTRQQLANELWGGLPSRVADANISQLRASLAAADADVEIATQRGEGFVLKPGLSAPPHAVERGGPDLTDGTTETQRLRDIAFPTPAAEGRGELVSNDGSPRHPVPSRGQRRQGR